MSLGGGGQGQQQLQQLSQEIQAIEGEIEELEADIDDLRQEQRDMDEAIDALGQIDTGSTIQVPLGGGAYVRAEVQDLDEVVVSLGGDYAAELEEDDAVDALETRKGAIDDQIETVTEEKQELESEREQLEAQAQQMQQQMQQQQMQQMQQMADEADDGDE
ncbi:prefoldin subunit alpha [Halobaculum lipolyticum]|uniref:Prefoldin subunit alpha n=1 Tax=Halobaculum lipolyticum TaxID=3032001 RepID=A0ABD5W9T2_9EURY|nr:prefoldin subunit alpha [Halobaculum sp. DT31]